METIEQLRRLAIFAKVVESGSFTQAGETLGLGKSSVSKQVARLEQELGLRLLNRSTRSLGLTDAGRQVYERCVRMLEEANDARRVAVEERDEVAGRLKVATGVEFGRRIVMPVIEALMKKHAKLEVQLLLHDQKIDLVEQGVDVGLRLGFFKDSQLVQRRLVHLHYGLFASPAFIERVGDPETPEAAAKLDWALISFLARANEWVFRGPRVVKVQASMRLASDSTVAVVEAALRGIALVPMLVELMRDETKTGQLVRVLPEYTLDPEVGLFAVYPHRRFQPAKVEVFVDAVEARMKDLTASV